MTTLSRRAALTGATAAANVVAILEKARRVSGLV